MKPSLAYVCWKNRRTCSLYQYSIAVFWVAVIGLITWALFIGMDYKCSWCGEKFAREEVSLFNGEWLCNKCDSDKQMNGGK